MIGSIRHRGLRLLYEKGGRRGIQPAQADKIERILARLDEATSPDGIDLPGYRLHPLRGDLAGLWAVSVSGNWRIVFRLDAGNARDVHMIDYH